MLCILVFTFEVGGVTSSRLQFFMILTSQRRAGAFLYFLRLEVSPGDVCRRGLGLLMGVCDGGDGDGNGDGDGDDD